MSSILAFDASSDGCSVTLSLSSGFLETLKSDEPRAHAAKLLPFTEELLKQAGVELNQIDAIACSAGPGSFTGLRIALSVAQGLAYAADLPIALVSSLATMVNSVETRAQDTIYCPLINARMNEVYWGEYLSDCSPLNKEIPAAVGGEKELAERLFQLAESHSNLVALGEDWLQVPFAADIINQLNLPFIANCRPNSFAVAELAKPMVADNQVVCPEEADLFYCRNSVAWNKRKRIRTE